MDSQNHTFGANRDLPLFYHDCSAINHRLKVPGYKGLERVDSAINSPDWYELRFGGLTIALVSDKERRERCQEAHQRVSQNLDLLTFDKKRLLLDTLAVKIITYHDHSQWRGALPSYVTIEQTWA